MVRLVLVIAVLAVGFVLVKRRRTRPAAGAAPRAALRRQHRRDAEGVPVAARRTARTRRRSSRQRGALPGLGVDPPDRGQLDRGGEAAAAPTRPFADVGSRARAARGPRRHPARLRARSTASPRPAAAPRPPRSPRTLAEVYSAPVLAALGADGRRAFAERYAGRTQVAQKVKVLDFDGVFVSGRRALAQVVYRLSMRAPLRPLRRPRPGDLDRHARPRGRPLALRPRPRNLNPA